MSSVLLFNHTELALFSIVFSFIIMDFCDFHMFLLSKHTGTNGTRGPSNGLVWISMDYYLMCVRLALTYTDLALFSIV
jgi:hypothetical protein